MKTWHTIVLGGGIVGAATAEYLAAQGKAVLLLEQFALGHDRGSSHGDGRIIRLSYPEPVYLQMAQRTYDTWRRLEKVSGQDLIAITGSWDCGPEDCPLLDDLAVGFEKNGIPYERLNAAASNRRFPTFHLPNGSEAIFQKDGGIVRAGRAVEILWKLAKECGATLQTNTRIVSIAPKADGIHLASEDGQRFVCENLALAAGGWMGGCLKSLGLDLPLEVTEESVYYLPANGQIDHTFNNMPTVIDYHDEHPFYALPQIDVPGVKVGWHRTGPIIDPDERAPEVLENLLPSILAFARDRIPNLGSEPIRHTTCLYTNTPDYHFVLDRHPDEPRITLAAGLSGHGFKFGPVLGECLASLALGEDPPVDLHTFRVERFQSDKPLQRRSTA